MLCTIHYIIFHVNVQHRFINYSYWDTQTHAFVWVLGLNHLSTLTISNYSVKNILQSVKWWHLVIHSGDGSPGSYISLNWSRGRSLIVNIARFGKLSEILCYFSKYEAIFSNWTLLNNCRRSAMLSTYFNLNTNTLLKIHLERVSSGREQQ